MKQFSTSLLILLSLTAFAQSPGDTIVVETFNYTQTHGWPWSGMIRDTMIGFPDNQDISYEKVIMLYNMRCKDGLVSDASDKNKGCGEWDYSCNTYIHDSSRVDSVLSFTNSYVISNFSGDTFSFVENAMYNYYQHIQKNVELNNIVSESQSMIGDGNSALAEVIPTFEYSGKSQYLFTQVELLASGLTAGTIDGILINVLDGTNEAGFFSLKMKNTSITELDNTTPEFEGFTQVFFDNTFFEPGEQRIQFYTPFDWDGTSNILCEFSFTNNENGNTIDIEGSDAGFLYGMFSYGDKFVEFNGFNYIESNDYKGISGAADRTCEAWIKTSVANKEIVSWGRNAAGQKWVFRLNDNGALRVEVNGGNVVGTTILSDNEWHHVACVFSGDDVLDVLLYVDGELETIAGSADELIDTNTEDGLNLRVSRGVNDRYFTGIIDEVRVWEAALSQETLQQWMYQFIDSPHPNYSDLAVYYAMNENSGSEIFDASGNEHNGAIINGTIRGNINGNDLFKQMSLSEFRPNINFLQGEYDLTISDEIVLENVQQLPHTIIEYEIIPHTGTMLHDEIAEVMNTLLWAEGYEYTFDTDGLMVDSIAIAKDGDIVITDLTYFNRYPMKFEIMSFVTPYGIYLDLGMEGKTWAFDVTDYMPILKGSKRMTIERGGEWQEDMDIKFLFIVGTPAREVLDVQQLWRADSKGYTAILDDRAFEPRDLTMNPEGEYFKIRTTITGHGQQGEFTGRNHFINIDGNEEFLWKVWTECASNPIYPQGGTWIYDRAGWCPGQASDLEESDITDLVTPGEVTNIDYGLQTASGTSNYIVNNQLVTYGPANFDNDATVAEVLRPNMNDARNDRFNPACTDPEIVIQNTGKNTLTSLEIEYKEQGGQVLTYNWSGSLDFMEKETVILPINDLNFWLPTSNVFVATVKNPNGEQDEYEYNNTYKSKFEGVDIYAEGDPIVIECKSNTYSYQNTYALSDGQGNIIQEWTDLEANTVYSDPFTLDPGCYKLRIEDTGGDGLEFWNKPSQGVGHLKIKNFSGVLLHELDPDFGNFSEYEFGVGEITSIHNETKKQLMAVFPNPTLDQVNVQLTETAAQEVIVQLMNVVGTEIYKETFLSSGKIFSTNINLEPYPAGVYFLSIENGSFKSVKKLVKK